MRRDPNDFLKSTKNRLAERAGHICSNPWCRQPTMGPHSDDTKSTNVGEAAHIRGARQGSGRYDPTMTPEERSIITNGIWLCARCAKLIDTDVPRYSVDLLYKWKREHEAEQAAGIGGDPSMIEERNQILKIYAMESPSAIQLAVDKPEHWNFLLAIELIRSKVGPIRQRLRDIDEGLTYKPIFICDNKSLPDWFQRQLLSILSLVEVLGAIVTRKIPSSWCASGTSPDATLILRATDLLRDACEGLPEWEQEVARTRFPDLIDDMRKRMQGWTHGILAELERIPELMSEPIRRRQDASHVIEIDLHVRADIKAFCEEFLVRYRQLQDPEDKDI